VSPAAVARAACTLTAAGGPRFVTNLARRPPALGGGLFRGRLRRQWHAGRVPFTFCRQVNAHPLKRGPQTAARPAAVLERSWNAAAATSGERRRGQDRESRARSDQRRPARTGGKARRGTVTRATAHALSRRSDVGDDAARRGLRDEGGLHAAAFKALEQISRHHHVQSLPRASPEQRPRRSRLRRRGPSESLRPFGFSRRRGRYPG
jgi:hypothetical protein